MSHLRKIWVYTFIDIYSIELIFVGKEEDITRIFLFRNKDTRKSKSITGTVFKFNIIIINILEMETSDLSPSASEP